VTTELATCCTDTIRQHVKHNPMMVCAACKNIIKCFNDERAYENYLTFCRSRKIEMSDSGLPLTAMTSAILPGSSVPI